MSENIPTGWIFTNVDKTCDVLDSKRIPINSEERATRKGQYPYYGANGIQGFIDDFIFEGEHLLLAEDGGNFDQWESRPISYLVSGRFWVNNHAHILKAKPGFETRYLHYSLVHKNITKHINGGTRAKLNQSDMRDISFVMPPLPEQQKIAAILTSVDEVIESTQAHINKLKDLKTGMMQELLTKGIGRDGRPHTEFKDSPVGRIPRGWDVKKLSDLVKPNKPITYGIVQTGDHIESGIPCVRVVDLMKENLTTENMIRTSEEISNQFKRTILELGDIMFALRGEIGHVRLVDRTLIGANLTRGVALISPNAGISSEYLLWVIRSAGVRQNILDRVNGSALQEIPLGNLRDVDIPIGDPNEQEAIVKTLNSIQNKLEQSVRKHALQKDIKKALMQDLLTGKVRVKVN